MLGYFILRTLAPRSRALHAVTPAEPDVPLRVCFGEHFFSLIRGKRIIDYGCGEGRQCVEMAQRGAARVVGIDINEQWLANGRRLAQRAGVADRCAFVRSTSEPADLIISKDSFEHYPDPPATLRDMARLLKPGGRLLIAFGPPWLHPHGGHLFSIFPWAHLLFSERALLRWRSDFKADGAARFAEVEGGLNQMTLARFEQLIAQSPFTATHFDTVPIKGLPFLRFWLFREFGSALICCHLVLQTMLV